MNESNALRVSAVNYIRNFLIENQEVAMEDLLTLILDCPDKQFEEELIQIWLEYGFYIFKK